MPAEEGVSEEIVVVVVSGGEPPDPRAAVAVPVGAPVVAADKGLEHALALGLEVSLAVGDFDSASPEAVAAAQDAGTRIERHPHAKDATDLELALDAAAALAPVRILVLAGTGGRLDHELSLLLLLGSERYSEIEIDALVGFARVLVVRGSRTLHGTPGELVSLLPLGRAEGVTTEGLEYPLRGETLDAGSSRGVSNVFESETGRVSVERGVLLAVRPGDPK
jgi:thiamine pyrophosphokinase